MDNNTQKENKLGTTLEMFTKEEIKDLEERIKDVKIYEKDIENLEKTDTHKKRIRTINNKQNGYINFYLILISTIFLSLLCILLSFMMLGLNIK